MCGELRRRSGPAAPRRGRGGDRAAPRQSAARASRLPRKLRRHLLVRRLSVRPRRHPPRHRHRRAGPHRPQVDSRPIPRRLARPWLRRRPRPYDFRERRRADQPDRHRHRRVSHRRADRACGRRRPPLVPRDRPLFCTRSSSRLKNRFFSTTFELRADFGEPCRLDRRGAIGQGEALQLAESGLSVSMNLSNLRGAGRPALTAAASAASRPLGLAALLAGAMILTGCAATRGGKIPYNVANFSQPDSPATTAIEEDYRVAPLDVLHISVFQAPELSGDFPVDLTGTITMPLLGSVKAVDMTTSQLNQKLAQMLGARY